jgi:hypothetical protein
MTRSSAVSTLSPEFNDFLFAPIEEDANGSLLSVLSALARLDVDPWQKAAELTGLPRDAARAALANLIVALPDGTSICRNLEESVARLVALLPSRSPRLKPSPEEILPGIRAAASVKTGLYAALFVVMMLVSMLTGGLQHPAPGAATPTATADTAAPRPPPTLAGKR